MSASRAKAHRAARGRGAGRRYDPVSWGLVIGIGAIVVFLLVTGAFKSEEKAAEPAGAGAIAEETAQGTAAPFSVVDAVTGNTMSLDNFAGRNLLLFFSEGVACQACMVQIQALEKKRAYFAKRNLVMAHVSVDAADSLKQAARQYGITTTPLLADEDAKMSSDYGMLGKGGMGHPNQDGHAFMVVSPKGKILWEKPYTSMYVEPRTLFDDMPKIKKE